MAEDRSSVPAAHVGNGHSELPSPPKSPHPSARPEVVAGTNLSNSSSPPLRTHEYLESLIPPSAEEFNRIASVQNGREDEIRASSREPKRALAGAKSPTQGSKPDVDSPSRPIEEQPAEGGRPTIIDDILLTRAATLIQRTYRGYRTRRQMAGLGIDADTRWTHALREARFRELTKPWPRSWTGGEAAGLVGDGKPQNSDAGKRSVAARRNWRKAAIVARRAGWDEDSASGSSSDESIVSLRSNLDEEDRKAVRKRRQESRAGVKKAAQTMGLQYFLEMVDQKHRYGSNLRTYHDEWKKSNTHENFFYWLDFGEGRGVEMEACPRDRLEREQVRYLGREERQYYLVKIDPEGRLCWAKNGARIDTTEEWRDSIKGIVPRDDTTPTYSPRTTNITRAPERSSTGTSHSSGGGCGSDGHTSDSELEAARAAKYANPTLDEAKGIKKVGHVSATTIFNNMLRKSVRKNTWIFVADTSFRLYVGIKDSGAFQHSSFLQGSRISAAGLIKIKNGRLKSLSPLSGHYRPPAANFRAFVKTLKDMGVDMSHVSISKSYAVLVGLEVYVHTRQKSKRVVQTLIHGKDKIMAPDEVARRREAEKDKSQSAAREREILEQEARARREEKASVRVLRKLGVQSGLDRHLSNQEESGPRDDVKVEEYPWSQAR